MNLYQNRQLSLHDYLEIRETADLTIRRLTGVSLQSAE